MPTAGSQGTTDVGAELGERLTDSFELITGLIRLRLRRSEHPECRDDLAWLLDIVTALGMLQQRLASDDGGAFAAYLTDVGAFWRRVAGERARITVEAARFPVESQRAAALAMIAHELLRDAVEQEQGAGASLRLDLRRLPDGQGELSLVSSAPSSGERDLWLVDGLVRQLGWTLTQEAGSARVRFAPQPPPTTN